MTEYEINQQVAEQICDHGSFDGEHYSRGSCVALLDGNVVAVAQDLEGALNGLRSLDADPERGMIFIVNPRETVFIR